MIDLPQTGVIRLLTSSKGIAFLASVIAVTTLAALHVLDGAQVVDFLKWVLPGYMAATAAEDFSKHLATRPRSLAPTATANVTLPPPAQPGIIIGDSLAPSSSTIAPRAARGREALDTPRDPVDAVPWDTSREPR